MDSDLIPCLEDFCYRYLNESRLMDVLKTGNKEEAEFYCINTKKILDYMHKNYIHLTGRLKSYMNDLEFTIKELEDIINKGKVIQMRPRGLVLRV